MNQNLMLLEQYSNYILNFEEVIRYTWMKEYFPPQYELIKKHLAEHTTINIETLTTTIFPRNILNGEHFYSDKFGMRRTKA